MQDMLYKVVINKIQYSALDKKSKNLGQERLPNTSFV